MKQGRNRGEIGDEDDARSKRMKVRVKRYIYLLANIFFERDYCIYNC